MNVNERYWASIAQRIAADFKNGHPEQWRKGDIELFLKAFLSKLEIICRQDPEKAERCGVPKIKNELRFDQLTLSYYSFRRIFITKESEGNLTTREMFAIYFGYDSFNDYLLQNDIKGDENTRNIRQAATQEDITSNKKAQNNSSRSKGVRLSVITLVGIMIIILLLRSSLSDGAGVDEKLLVFRHDKGITIINTNGKEPIQIRTEGKITGIDIDVQERLIFWSSYPFGHISKGKLTENFDKLEPGYTIFQLIDSIPGPAGIAVNPKNKVFYCAMHLDSTIVEYDYNGQLIDRDLVKGLKGKPSSVEFDFKNNVLYWTDVSNGKIGKFNLATGETDHSFINNAGYFPDGLSIDTINNILYWTNRYDCQIGWTSLSNIRPFFADFDWETAAVEVDAENNAIFYSVGKSDFINRGSITKKGIDFNNNSFLETGNNEPSVLKLIKLNNQK